MSKFVKFLDWGSAIHLFMAWILGLPATAFGIFNLFLFPNNWALSLILIPTGTYCILHVKYDDLSNYISTRLFEEERNGF